MGDFVQFLEQSDKMAFGKLFTKGSDNTRTTAIMAVAKANNLDLEVITADPQKPTVEHLKANALGKIPAFLGEDGFALSEAIAVAIYVTSQNEKTTLLGKTKQDYASILKWMSFFNTEVLPPLGGWFRPLLGLDSYNKKNVEESSKKALRASGARRTPPPPAGTRLSSTSPSTPPSPTSLSSSRSPSSPTSRPRLRRRRPRSLLLLPPPPLRSLPPLLPSPSTLATFSPSPLSLSMSGSATSPTTRSPSLPLGSGTMFRSPTTPSGAWTTSTTMSLPSCSCPTT